MDRLEKAATRRTAIAIAIALAMGLAGCAPAATPPAHPAPTSSPATTAGAKVKEAPTEGSSPSPRELGDEHTAAYARAVTLALRRMIDAAIHELEPVARKVAERTDTPLAYWIHNELTWLHWGRGDARGALQETELGSKALDRSKLTSDEIASMRLHALWDRAYLLLELGDAAAQQAFADYESLAKVRSDHDGLAVLSAFFLARRGRGRDAMHAAKLVDVEKDTDLQDLYVIAIALDAGGDRPAARLVRERVCKGNEYLMKPLILEQMQREGFACPR